MLAIAIRSDAPAFGGKNGSGRDMSLPEYRPSVCRIPSLDSAYTTCGSGGAGGALAGAGVGAAARAAAWRSRRYGSTPSPGALTALEYAPRSGSPRQDGMTGTSVAGRVAALVAPPGQTFVRTMPPSSSRCQNTTPVSSSTANTRFARLVMNDTGLLPKPKLPKTTPSASALRGALPSPSVAFHRSVNPGFCIDSGEMNASLRIHEVRCASARLVT